MTFREFLIAFVPAEQEVTMQSYGLDGITSTVQTLLVVLDEESLSAKIDNVCTDTDGRLIINVYVSDDD